MQNSSYFIEKLQLVPHPEGGYYREVYRSKEKISGTCLPERFSGRRNFSTAIYFLLRRNDFSAIHRINQDELWHFYAGLPVVIHVFLPEQKYRKIILGNNKDNTEFIAVVPAGAWFGAHPYIEDCSGDSPDFSLVGCTVAPGFDFKDFELAQKDKLLSLFPESGHIIKKLTG